MSELLFNGATAYCRVEEQQWSPPLLAIRPHKNQFTFIVVPAERLLSVAPVPHARFSHWQVELHGELSRTGDGSSKAIGPMADTDAQGMSRAIAERYGLPRVPRVVEPREVPTLPADTYVTAVGRYNAGHFEAANFEGVMISTKNLEPGRSYRVTGFTSPGLALGHTGPRPVGYSGPRITVIAIEPV
jgi:hypothetical protein